MSKTILTDCDGVLLDWEKGFEIWMGEQGYVKIPDFDVTAYGLSVHYGMTKEKIKKLIREFNSSAAIGYLKPFRDATRYVPALYASLGIYIPLIVVNCLILARAEAFANKNTIFDSMFDGIGMGLGFTLALTILGGVREILGSGSLFNLKFIGDNDGILIFVLAPGAFITLGYIIALINSLSKKKS